MSIIFAKAAKTVTLVIIVLVFLIVIQTINFPDHQFVEEECTPDEDGFVPLTDAKLKRFTQALQLQTVSTSREGWNSTALLLLHEHIKKSFPLFHSDPHIKREVIGNYSLLYTWKGSNPKLKPIMLCSHLDVVPVPRRAEWSHDPFGGKVEDGFIWGRGALDDKVGVFGLLEAAESILEKSGTEHRFPRTVYFAFGHDEEVGGNAGARAISQVLEDRNVQLEYLLDEGMPVGDGLVPGLSQPVAMIGSAEKGELTIELSVELEGGHSSMPKPESAISVIADAVSRINRYRHPDLFAQGGPDGLLFEHIATRMSLAFRVVMSNLWLFRPLLSMFLSTIPSANTAVRTTTAVTVIRGGAKSNVLPPSATAIVNHRVHPLDTCAKVLARDAEVIDDPRVKMRVLSQTEPSPISPVGTNVFGYQAIARSIRQVYHNTLVAPGLFIANSDTRHYWELTPNIYRFLPAVLTKKDLARLHGVDERISLVHYQKVINFYHHLLLNSGDFVVQASTDHSEL